MPSQEAQIEQTENMAESIEPNKEMISSFGYELIREELLHDLLGKDAPDILYWAGKRLARKYPLQTEEDLFSFFVEAGWGKLTKNLENKKEIEYELTSEVIQKRCKENAHATFQLEAGFIAQQIEQKKEVICETFEHPRKKGGKVLFTVKWDKKDIIHT
ncbi:YslB family protein [Cytobacillus kochii]|uniref:YslB family protein n=1 Tax=Cytobacillus TaxID=2675230 RepID=UPI002AFF5C19|nr:MULTISPECIES: YslB family protein [Cytobacillus]MEA1853334.1 YslB family protein [Cytobacillus sp. OWB-43]MED1603931.1 YslB family protein [Cytobacillus kochii]